jgi:hypothetical protein
VARSAKLIPFSRFGIGDFLFDPTAFCGCANLPVVEMELNG